MSSDRDELVTWFEDEDNAGVAGNAELAELIDEDEQVIRREGRLRGVRRVGSTMVWTLDDALALFNDLTESDEDDEDDDEDSDEDDEDE